METNIYCPFGVLLIVYYVWNTHLYSANVDTCVCIWVHNIQQTAMPGTQEEQKPQAAATCKLLLVLPVLIQMMDRVLFIYAKTQKS